MLMYLFGVLFIQLAEEELARVRGSPEEQEFSAQELRIYWGSLGSAVYTLYLSISGGIDWKSAAQPLEDISASYLVPVCTYIAVALFCMLNTVTGIFVEKANSIVSADKDRVLWDELAKRKTWVDEVKRSFKTADADGSGELSWEEFSEQMQNLKVQTDLKMLGIDVLVTEPETLFELFDFDGNGTIEIDEFATGVQKLHGPASAIDLAALTRFCRHLRQDVAELSQKVSGLLNHKPPHHACL
jgi:hypothetical protein